MIHQFAAVLEEHDAVGNEAAALAAMFESWGGTAGLYACRGGTLFGKTVQGVEELRALTPKDTLLIHYSHGAACLEEAFACGARKYLLYHRVTPARQLRGIDPAQAESSQAGAWELTGYAGQVEASVAHSECGRRELEAAGAAGARVIPYLLHAPLYAASPSNRERERMLLVVGRVAPHKAVEDALFVLAALRELHKFDWRLTIAGDPRGAEAYRERLGVLAVELGIVEFVHFAGRVSQAELIGLFQRCCGLLFLSEHEGFGVPLVEAMRFDVPVFAYDAGATAETLGGGGVLFRDKDPAVIAEAVALITRDRMLREEILSRQRERLRELSPEAISRDWRALFASTPKHAPAASQKAQAPTGRPL